MEERPSFQFGPTSTPLPLKILLGTIGALSLFSSWLIPYLSLSLPGIYHGFFWQPATYSLIHPFPIGILQLLINLYLIWTFGASLIERLHPIRFFSLYFGASIVSGCLALLGMSLTHTIAPFMGSSAVLLGLLVSWTLLNSEAQLLLFFALPLKAAHLILIFIGITFVIDISQGQWIHLLANTGSILFGYLFTLITFRAHSPFHFLRFFENGLFRTLEKLNSWKTKPYHHTKVYDIKSGAPLLNDEQFMDAMLARISLYGEDSLTVEEKRRMHEISEKKPSKKK